MTILHVRTGRVATDEALQIWLGALTPSYSVLEPAIVLRPGGKRGATPGFRGLVAGRIDPGESRISELRLDWNDGCLLFVADGAGYLWSCLALREDFAPVAGQGEAQAPLEGLVETQERALWRNTGELGRFATAGERRDGGPPARIVKFQRGPHLVAWWFQQLG